MRLALLALLAMVFQETAGSARNPLLTSHLIDEEASESLAVFDVDRDGLPDIMSGAYWYQAPHWTRYQFRDVTISNDYIDSFSLLPVDVDGDGYVDVVDVSWFAKRIAWWRNPGRAWGPSAWQDQTIHACCNIEFAVLADINNDGEAREILAQENGTGQAWYELSAGTWSRHVASDRSYGHGIGAGDVNGDGRTDILTPAGWLEAPPDPRASGWTLHPAWADVNVPLELDAQAPLPTAPNSSRRVQLGFLHVADVNEDGRNDVLTSAGHDYGVFWFEQQPAGWTRHVIDHSWSQGHASTLADLDGDGRPSLVTGKRYMAHNGKDPGAQDPLGLYSYAWSADTQGPSGHNVSWVKQAISTGGRVGAGMQIVAIDLDNDHDHDLVVAGKSGLFWIENQTSPSRAGSGARAKR